MRPTQWIGIIVLVLIVATATTGAAETVITTSGSVLQGQIEFGIPGVISVTSSTGDIFTVQRSNLKAIRFPLEEGGEVTVETFDGNILVGAVGGIPEVIGLRTAGGDVQSVKLTSIQEIRFDQVAPAPTPTTPAPTTITAPTIAAEILAEQVKEVYKEGRWGFTIGLDIGYQLGVSTLNGFGYPTSSFGANALSLGIVWRSYLTPTAKQIEKAALEIARETPEITLDELLTATTAAKTPRSSFYLHLGTNTFFIPEIGIGWLFRLSQVFYFDAGAAVDLFLFPWFSLGFLLIF
ncbi:TPA: hypothetical protein DIT45_01385 [Candidatus Acetothermia bacterium]|nr:hypothetical protein [Candidatus Acetothermia bacterium]